MWVHALFTGNLVVNVAVSVVPPFLPCSYTLASFLYYIQFHAPNYLKWFMEADLTPTYEFLRWQLKYLSVSAIFLALHFSMPLCNSGLKQTLVSQNLCGPHS